MNKLTQRVLVLNRNYEPVTMCSAKKAIVLMYLNKVDPVETDATILVRSKRMSYELPLVIKLRIYTRLHNRDVLPTRENVLMRDGYTCQYCGKSPKKLTIDHVIPKARGGKRNWSNLVTSCEPCNARKADRTPKQAGMKLIHQPKKPSYYQVLAYVFNPIRNEWKPYLFIGD